MVLPAFMGNKKPKRSIRCLGLLLFVLERSQSLRATMPASWSGCRDRRTDEAQTLLRVGLDRHRGRDVRTHAGRGRAAEVARAENRIIFEPQQHPIYWQRWCVEFRPIVDDDCHRRVRRWLHRIASHRIEIAKGSRLDSFVTAWKDGAVVSTAGTSAATTLFVAKKE